MTAFVWDGAGANAWASDHWGRGGVAPVYPGDTGSAVGDTIEIDASANCPAAGPVGALTVAAYTCYGGNFDCGADLTVTGALTLGTAAGADAPVFSGTAAAGCVCIFQGASVNDGTVADGPAFSDDAENSGTCGDHASFTDTALNSGTVGDYATFSNAAENTGTAGDYATFNGTPSINNGTVGDHATFSGGSYNDALGTCGENATFASSGVQDGEFTGTDYTVSAATVFAATAKFSGGTPTFALTNANATVTGPITSDGGTTPLGFTVQIAAQTDLAAANILNTKTILGVAGTATPILRVGRD